MNHDRTLHGPKFEPQIDTERRVFGRPCHAVRGSMVHFYCKNGSLEIMLFQSPA